ncbi:hypothetical protein IMZ48_40940 [Candidatus Bathyarchaeota archaeon]|nr:hypothetical protein [Candidatus Bathyarchaeota archaeon]
MNQQPSILYKYIVSRPGTRAEHPLQSARLLISQDRHEIYLNIATFEAEYVDYFHQRYGT